MEKILFDYLSKYITLSAEEKKAIVDLDIFKQYKKGTVLLKEGDFSEDGYFVLKGCIRCYYIIDGIEKTTEFYTEAESLEPLCKINKQASKQYVECTENSILLVANTKMEMEIFEKFPKFESFCRVFTETLLAKSKEAFDEFKVSSPEQRYLHLLQKRPSLVQRVPQHQLASFLGVTPQSLSRLKARLLEKRV